MLKDKSMKVPAKNPENPSILELTGRIESHTVPNWQKRLAQAATSHTPHLIVDLSNVTFIDSSGLVMFMQNLRRCRENGGDLYLCNPQRPVRRILELTQLNKAIEIFPNQTEAYAAFMLSEVD